MAIKASIQTAIQEGVSVLQPCDSFGGKMNLYIFDEMFMVLLKTETYF